MATFDSIDITEQFDTVDLSSGNEAFSSINITEQFNNVSQSLGNEAFPSIDLTGPFDTIDSASDAPQDVTLLPFFVAEPVVDPAVILFNEGDFEPTLPVASFIPSVISGAIPLSVSFTNTSSGTITERHWSFGDGGISTSVNPTHIYTTVGTYTVYLRIFGGPYYSQATTTITVTSVIADFSADVFSGPANLTVNFSDLTTGTPTSWDWNFGDGSPIAHAQNPSHIYTIAGSYTVSLIVDGGASSKVKDDYIAVSLSPDFTATPTTISAGSSVQFTDQSKGGAISWHWNFGDGATATDQNPSHVYPVAGVYTVTLSINGGAAIKIKSDYITVNLIADFVGLQTSGRLPLAVEFLNRSIGVPTSWDWDFGDSTPHGSVEYSTHVYTRAGLYTVTMTVSSGSLSAIAQKPSYIHVFAHEFSVATEDTSVPIERQDLRIMYGLNTANYLFIRNGLRVIVPQSGAVPGAGGLSRPGGPSIAFD